MDSIQAEEIEYFDKTLQMFCYLANQVMNSSEISSVKYKQKMCAITSFLEFIKAGADISVENKTDDKVTFNICLK